jgi:hypothetical protein
MKQINDRTPDNGCLTTKRPDRGPIPRASREEVDGLKPIRPIAYRKPGIKQRAEAKPRKSESRSQ